MALLKRLSTLGVTVMCIIHQPRPEVLDLLDGLTVLHRGHQIYHGGVAGLTNHLSEMGFGLSEKSNVADAVLDIISGHGSATAPGAKGITPTLDDLLDHWRPQALKLTADFDREKQQLQQHIPNNLLALTTSPTNRGASQLQQSRLCFTRSLKQQWAHKTSFLMEIWVGAWPAC